MALVLDEQNTSFSNETAMGDTSAHIEAAEKIIPSITKAVGKVTLKIRKSGSPTDDVFVKVYTESGGDPNTQVGGNSDVISGASLTGSLVDTDFTWSSNLPMLTNGTSYWVSFCRSGSPDGSNYYLFGVGNVFRVNHKKFSPWADGPAPFSFYFKEYYEEGYTRGDVVGLPTDDTDLETVYSAGDVTDVETNNGVRVAQTATNQYMIHQFKDYIGSAGACNVSWEGQTTWPPASSTVNLQIYNRNTTTWETIDSDNTTAEDTDFTLSANIADTTNYKDGDGYISCRVYQQATF